LINCLKNLLKKWRGQLIAKGWRYWLFAAFLLSVSVYLSPLADSRFNLIGLRYTLFQWIGEKLSPRPPTPRFVKLVLINEDEYRLAQANKSGPINRKYLADLVRALDAANVALIALDFQMHLRDPDAKGTYDEIPELYRKDTDALVAAIAEAAKRRSIVLSKEFRRQEDAFRADYYAPYGICTRLNSNGKWESPGSSRLQLTPVQRSNLSCGYIALTVQKWQIPSPAEIDNAGLADSFSLAIVRAWNVDAAKLVGQQALYTDYISPRTISRSAMVASARSVRLHDPVTFRELRFKPVIVGGAWLDENGDHVDMHSTPVGEVNGAIIHANFAEAVLDGRLYPGIAYPWMLALEILAGIVVAIVFALNSGLSFKFALFFAMGAGLLLMQLVMFLVWGTFFDALVPLVGMLVHQVIERFVRSDHSSPAV
jgi:hypothetical protein